MVFGKLSKVWKRKNLLSQALNELTDMFKDDRVMFEAAIGALFEGKKVKIDMYKEDKKINRYETEIRKKILEHLAINPSQDVIGSLILIDISRDVERIGDFSKNLFELSYIYKKPLHGSAYVYKLIKIEQKVQEMFDLTEIAFDKADKEAAKKVMEMHLNEIAPELSRMIEEIVNDKKIDTKKAVICALCSRYLKRVSAHLKGIASTVINPFDKIRHRTEHLSLVERKNIPAWKLRKD